jgi:hypothetical protein
MSMVNFDSCSHLPLLFFQKNIQQFISQVETNLCAESLITHLAINYSDDVYIIWNASLTLMNVNWFKTKTLLNINVIDSFGATFSIITSSI